MKFVFLVSWFIFNLLSVCLKSSDGCQLDECLKSELPCPSGCITDVFNCLVDPCSEYSASECAMHSQNGCKLNVEVFDLKMKKQKS
jgi:hypothetical protein